VLERSWAFRGGCATQGPSLSEALDRIAAIRERGLAAAK